MPLSNRYRRVLVANLNIRNEERVPPYVSRYSFEEVKEIIARKHELDVTTYLFQKESRLIRIKDIQECQSGEDKFFCLLLSLSDKDAPDAVYENFENGETRRFPKEENEGNATTAHVLINQSTKFTTPYHLVLIEKATGLTISIIERYLTFLLNDKLFMVTYEKEGEQKPYRPIFEILGHQSNTIRRALETGIVQDIELISHKEKSAGFDEYPFVKEEKEEFQIVLQEKVDPNKFKEFVQVLRGKPDYSKFEHMFVRIKDDGEGTIKRAEIDPDTDFLEDAFIQTELLKDFETPLEQAHAGIRDDMVVKMLKIMEKTLRRAMKQNEKILEAANHSISSTQAPVLSAD